MGQSIKFGRRDIAKKKHWHDSYFESDFSIPNSEKKKIICLPGDQCNSPKKANGMCKLAESFLSEAAKEKCEIWSAYWPDRLENDYERFFTHHFLPVIANEQGVQKAKSGIKLDKTDALPISEAKRNMRKVILFNHCKGSYVTKDLENYLCGKMSEMGYGSEDISIVMKQLFVLNANDPDEPFGNAKTSVLRCVSFSDKISMERKSFGNMKYVLSHNPPEQDVDILQCSANEGIVFANKVTDGETDNFNEHDNGFLVYEKMNASGKNIFDLSGALLSNIILSDDEISDISVMLDKAGVSCGLSDFVSACETSGKKYMSQLAEKITDYEKSREHIINLIKKGELTELPVTADACMLSESYKGTESVADYAVKKGNEKQITLVLKRIRETETVKEGHCSSIQAIYNKLDNEQQAKLQHIFEPFLNYTSFARNYYYSEKGRTD